VLKEPIIRQVISECEEYRSSGYVFHNPGKFLDKIYSIRLNVAKAEEPYTSFLYFYHRNKILKQIFALTMGASASLPAQTDMMTAPALAVFDKESEAAGEAA